VFLLYDARVLMAGLGRRVESGASVVVVVTRPRALIFLTTLTFSFRPRGRTWSIAKRTREREMLSSYAKGITITYNWRFS